MRDANIDDMGGKTVLVTGGTAGIGERSAAALARLGARVIITGRDATRSAAAAALLREETGGSVVGMALDLESLADVRRFAAELLREHPRLDVLVNNAGAGYPERRTTSEGLEASLAINHFGPFLLTHLLLGALQAAAPARVVFVNSGLHRMAKLDWDDLQFERNYKGFPDAYGRAKLVSLLCTYELARRLEPLGVSVHIADPGMAATNYGKTWTGWTRLFYYTLLRPFQQTPEKAARSTIVLATDPSYARRSGIYVGPPAKEIKSSPASYDQAAGLKLFALSEQLVGLRAQ